MTKRRYAFAILIVLALIANIPYVSMAQNTQSSQVPTAPGLAGTGGRQTPQPTGGVATVIGVDQPENCLRIRSGPGGSYDVIGCAKMGEKLNITGVWTSNDWAQLADNAWVYGPQIQTDLRPPRTAFSRSPRYVVTEDVQPDYGDWAYLPDYGYDRYWYGGVPLFFYDINVWQRYHPWWWHRGHQAWWWQGGHRGRRAWNATQFRNFARTGPSGAAVTNRANVSSFNRTGTRSSFTTNRSNISPSNVNRFNTNRFRSGSTNAFRSRTFSSPHTFRSGPTNAFRSRTFSNPSGFRSGNFGARTFSGPHIGGGDHFGGGRHR